MPLYQLGALSFETTPANLHEMARDTGADFAAKDVVGAQRPREFMGAADEKVNLSGRVFPHRFGGLDELDLLTEMSTSGDPQILVRGDGAVLGWYFIEKLTRKETYLNGAGVGRWIEFEVTLVSSPQAASPASLFTTLLRLIG